MGHVGVVPGVLRHRRGGGGRRRTRTRWSALAGLIVRSRTDRPLLVLRRPGWTEQPGDRWLRVPDLHAAAACLAALPPGTVLLTTGRSGLPLLAADPRHRYLARVLDPAQVPPPPGVQLLPWTGPTDARAGLALLRRFDVTAVVTKDSGGPAAAAVRPERDIAGAATSPLAQHRTGRNPGQVVRYG